MHPSVENYNIYIDFRHLVFCGKIKLALLQFRSTGQCLEESSGNEDSWILFLATAVTHAMTFCKPVDLCACLPMLNNEKRVNTYFAGVEALSQKDLSIQAFLAK